MTSRQLIGRTLLVVVIAALTATIAYGFSSGRPKRYDATTKLLFAPVTPELQAVGLGAINQDEDRRSANNTAAVASFDVARAAARDLHDPLYSAERVAADISVANARGSDVVSIKALAPRPAEAARLVAVYRRAFILRDIERVQKIADRARNALREALIQLTPAQRRAARGETLRAQIGTLDVLSQTGAPPTILEGVRSSSGPVTPQTFRDTLFGLLFGLLLGIGLVSLRGATRSDATARDPAASGRLAAAEKP